MENKVLSLVVVFFLVGTMSVFAQNKKGTFKVYGNCGMCEDRIEKAAKTVDGVSKVKWVSEKQQLTVIYDESKTKPIKIQDAIAKVGHDTELKKADDRVYANLHGCCKYDRPNAKAKGDKKKAHSHEGCNHSH